MTIKDIVRDNFKVGNIKAFYMNGMIDLLGACQAIAEYYEREILTREEANEALRQIMRLKPRF